jgi:hypothetical protein
VTVKRIEKSVKLGNVMLFLFVATGQFYIHCSSTFAVNSALRNSILGMTVVDVGF